MKWEAALRRQLTPSLLIVASAQVAWEAQNRENSCGKVLLKSSAKLKQMNNSPKTKIRVFIGSSYFSF